MGAWYAGKLLKEQFEDKYNIEIDFFVDNKEHGKIDNIRVLTPNVLNKKMIIILYLFLVQNIRVLGNN